MPANRLDATVFNNAATNTVQNAVIDPNALLSWRQNVKAVVDQHATEIDGKVNKAGDTITGYFDFVDMDGPRITLRPSADNGSLSSILYKSASGLSIWSVGHIPSTRDFSLFDVVANVHRFRMTIDGQVILTSGARIITGTGSPEGVVTAPPGSIYLNASGGASTTLYVKQSGTGNTGWIAK